MEAESWALLLGARLAVVLNLQVVNFLTDNEILASAAKIKGDHRTSTLVIGHYDQFLPSSEKS